RRKPNGGRRRRRVSSASLHCTAHHSSPIRSVIGRERELDERDRLSQALLNGESRSLIIHGEEGIGKTSILERFVETHPSSQIVTCCGVVCEAELAWAALHQLFISMLKYLPRISPPHSAALKAAFGLTGEATPDPLLCGLGGLDLLREAAADRPVICVIDDAQALDRESLRTLGFVSRRLRAESVGMIFAVREIPSELANIPRLRV